MNKVCLIAHQGSGTNLLRSFLNSHNDIQFYDEIFNKKEKFSFLRDKANHIERKEFLDSWFDENRIENKNKKVIGVDLKYNQLSKLPDVEEYIRSSDFKVLHLVRDTARAALRGVNEINQKDLTYDIFMKDIANINRLRDYMTNKFEVKGDNYLKIYYEDMTRGQEINELPKDFEEKILNWLEVPYQKLKLVEKEIRPEKLLRRFN